MGTWTKIGEGNLYEKSASRIELSRRVTLHPNETHCIYIATNNNAGIAYVKDAPAAENEDLKCCIGTKLQSQTHFSSNCSEDSEVSMSIHARRFNGMLEYD